jgi:hypothetical protein
MCCVIQNTVSPSSFDEEAIQPAKFDTSNSLHYLRELRHLIDRYVDGDEQRSRPMVDMQWIR